MEMPVQHVIFELIDPAGMPVIIARMIVGYDDIGKWPVGSSSSTRLYDAKGNQTGWIQRISRIG